PPAPYPLSLRDALPISTATRAELLGGDRRVSRDSTKCFRSGRRFQRADTRDRLQRYRFLPARAQSWIPQSLDPLRRVLSPRVGQDRKSTRLYSRHVKNS